MTAHAAERAYLSAGLLDASPQASPRGQGALRLFQNLQVTQGPAIVPRLCESGERPRARRAAIAPDLRRHALLPDSDCSPDAAGLFQRKRLSAWWCSPVGVHFDQAVATRLRIWVGTTNCARSRGGPPGREDDEANVRGPGLSACCGVLPGVALRRPETDEWGRQILCALEATLSTIAGAQKVIAHEI